MSRDWKGYADLEDVLAGRKRVCVITGDCLDVMRSIPDGVIDAAIQDPPSAIGLMGKAWDRARGGFAPWVEWLGERMAESRRVVRDGGRSLTWALPRTSHWTGCGVEVGDWFIENTITHLFGQGWPKAQSQLKPAAETWFLARSGAALPLNVDECRVRSAGPSPSIERRESARRSGVTPAGTVTASGWERRNSADHYLAERPGEADGRWPPNVVLTHARGCLCIGQRRVTTSGPPSSTGSASTSNVYGRFAQRSMRSHGDDDGLETVDEWQCVEGCPVAELDRLSGARGAAARASGTTREGESTSNSRGRFAGTDAEAPFYGDEGTASRFFPQFAWGPLDDAVFHYAAKPSRGERNLGCEEMEAKPLLWSSGTKNPGSFQSPGTRKESENDHPTVKPVELMEWFVRLLVPPGGVVIDGFAGSGTTGVAALRTGRRAILIESDDQPGASDIARARCEAVDASPEVLARRLVRPLRPVPKRRRGASQGDGDDLHGPLFNRKPAEDDGGPADDDGKPADDDQ